MPSKPTPKTAKPKRAPISNQCEIKMHMHCALCLREKPDNVSPAEWQDVSVGWTPVGIQIWCQRHQVNIAHIDFEGARHPANVTSHIAPLTH